MNHPCMVEQCRSGYWAIKHFNLFIADIPLSGHIHTPEKHEPNQQHGHGATLDRSDLESNEIIDVKKTI